MLIDAIARHQHRAVKQSARTGWQAGVNNVGDGHDPAIATLVGLPNSRHAGQTFNPVIVRLPWVLLLLCLIVTVLLAVIGCEVIRWSTQATANVPITPRDNPILGDRDSIPDGHDHQAMWLKEILARPLFIPGRQGIDDAGQGLPRLTGIIVAGPQRLAMFSASSSRPSIVVKAGGYFGDYEVRSITERGVLVGGPRGMLFLKPSFEPVPPPEPPALPAFPTPLERLPPGLMMSQ